MRALVLVVMMVVGTAERSGAQKPPAHPVNVDSAGVTLGGYDAVAYFTVGEATKGSPAFELAWAGARWRFASAAHRDRFAKAPEQFAPQFGGYCAWAVSRNYTADVDPTAFAVVNGKLYLNYSAFVQARWRLDRDDNIAKGHQNWPSLLAQAKATNTSKTGGR